MAVGIVGWGSGFGGVLMDGVPTGWDGGTSVGLWVLGVAGWLVASGRLGVGVSAATGGIVGSSR